jgi:hypothetical protein
VDHADGLADIGDTPAIEPVTTVRERAADRLRELRPGEQNRRQSLAQAAIVTSMAAELLDRSRAHDTTPESRRLAIQLAHSAIGRHYSAAKTQHRIARRDLLH